MKSLLLSGAAAVFLTGLSAPVAAQQADVAQADVAQAEAAQADSGVADIIVTAQKREENLQDVPISIVALTTAGLERAGIKDITDLPGQVPALQITPHPNSATTARVFIRGIGNNDDQVTQDPSVAIYLDGVYVARSQGLAMEVAEIERIEVLRGPQGSLYGRNATGGAINFITRAPAFETWGADQRFTYGNRDQFRTRTRLNIPIGSTLAVELAYLHTAKNGFVDNVGTGAERFGDQRRDGYRAAVRWSPVPDLDIRYAYDRSVVNDTPAFLAAVPFYPATAPRPTKGSPAVRDLQPNHVVAQGHSLHMNWDIGDNLTLRSITGYRKLKNHTYMDYLTGALGPFPLFITTFDSNQKQFSEELQLVGSTADNSLQYVIGAYYFSESTKSYDTTSLPVGPRIDRDVTSDNKAYALFSEATWTPSFADGRLHLTVGGRWSKDHRKATYQRITVPSVGAPSYSQLGAGDRTFNKFSPSAVIRYDLTPEANIYAKVVSGYKTGGFNVRASSIESFNRGFGQETLVSYEIGSKSSLLDRRLRLNLALFQAQYRDIQLNVQVPGTVLATDVLNAGRARIRGAEVDITAVPVDGLTFNFNYAWTEGKYTQILDGSGNDVTSEYFYAYTPGNTLTTGLEFSRPIGNFADFTASVDYSYRDRRRSSSNDGRYFVGAYGLLNARLALNNIQIGPSEWSLAVFGKNLTDESYYLDHFNAGLPTAIFGEPRTYGLELGVKF